MDNYNFQSHRLNININIFIWAIDYEDNKYITYHNDQIKNLYSHKVNIIIYRYK